MLQSCHLMLGGTHCWVRPIPDRSQRAQVWSGGGLKKWLPLGDKAIFPSVSLSGCNNLSPRHSLGCSGLNLLLTVSEFFKGESASFRGDAQRGSEYSHVGGPG